MSARCSLVVNGKPVRVSTGDTPLEAALAEGMIAPQASLHGNGLLGQGASSAARRGSARYRVADAPKNSPRPNVVLEAAALRPATEIRPAAPVRRTGSLAALRHLSPGIVEVVVLVERPMPFEPGHQAVVTFSGAPPLNLSPTLHLDGSTELNELVFHLPVGHASGLAEGDSVKVKGPVGRAFYRPGGGRLVLVAAGTGFAPIWSIARAARYVEPAREMVLIAGARDPLDLTMRPALDWLRATGITRIVLAADRNRQRPPDVRPGPLTAHVPSLRANDVVHVAGCASTVGAVEVLAATVGARCYPVIVPD